MKWVRDFEVETKEGLVLPEIPGIVVGIAEGIVKRLGCGVALGNG
jgi:hypothetical protein